MWPDLERSGANYYPAQGLGATARLTQGVMEMIDTRGPISFREFFDFVLYEPENGYYSRPEEVRTGREGDFFTAVSVGSLFGRILARSAQRVWKELAEPECFRIVEWGAEQGDLARDISTGIAEIGGAFEQAVQYAVVEPIAKKAAYLLSLIHI